MNVAQIEHTRTFLDPLPKRSTVDLMEALVDRRKRQIQLLADLTADITRPGYLTIGQRMNAINQIEQTSIRLRETIDDIVEVAGRIYSERAALEVTQ